MTESFLASVLLLSGVQGGQVLPSIADLSFWP